MSDIERQESCDILNRLLALLADIDRILAPHRRRPGSQWRVDSPPPPPLPQAPSPKADERQPPRARGIESWGGTLAADARPKRTPDLPWVEPAALESVETSLAPDPDDDEPPPNGGTPSAGMRTRVKAADKQAATTKPTKPSTQTFSSQDQRNVARVTTPQQTSISTKRPKPPEQHSVVVDSNQPALPATQSQNRVAGLKARTFAVVPAVEPVSTVQANTVQRNSDFRLAYENLPPDMNTVNNGVHVFNKQNPNQQSSTVGFTTDASLTDQTINETAATADFTADFDDSFDQQTSMHLSRRFARGTRSRFIRRRKILCLSKSETKALERRIDACFLDKALRRVG